MRCRPINVELVVGCGGCKGLSRSAIQMCREMAANGLEIVDCVYFGFYLRQLHFLHCVSVDIAFQSIVYRILYGGRHLTFRKLNPENGSPP